MAPTKTVFISGIAGFLGSHLARALLAEGYRVTGCDNLLGGDLKNVPPGALRFVADCCDLTTMKRLTYDADIVVHCAATAYEGYSMCCPTTIAKNIYDASVCLATAAVHNKVKRFVFCSSRARYGDQESPFTEDMEPRPRTPYAVAKVAAEQTLQRMSEFYGMELVIAVPHSIIGVGQKYDDPYRNVASIFINRMLKGKQPIIYGDGSQKHSFSVVDDCIPCLVAMVKKKKAVGEIINIGPDEEHSMLTVNELAQMIADKLDFELDPIYQGSRPNETKLTHCSAAKARELLGYETKHTVSDALDAMIKYIREKGTKPFSYHIPIEIKHKKIPEAWSKKLV